MDLHPVFCIQSVDIGYIKITSECLNHGLDITCGPILIGHATHYMCEEVGYAVHVEIMLKN